VGNSIVMLLAGYETTSGTMQFLAYNLAQYQECQEKLRQEIKDAVKQNVSCFGCRSPVPRITRRLSNPVLDGVTNVVMDEVRTRNDSLGFYATDLEIRFMFVTKACRVLFCVLRVFLL